MTRYIIMHKEYVFKTLSAAKAYIQDCCRTENWKITKVVPSRKAALASAEELTSMIRRERNEVIKELEQYKVKLDIYRQRLGRTVSALIHIKYSHTHDGEAKAFAATILDSLPADGVE
jgi:hypothetical protein